jgi:flagellar basal-body rod modification protein FlgD
MTNPIQGTQSTTASAASAGSAASGTSDAADRFLTLLVTQLKNQDPLNPLDNAQVTTQLAQISTVSGINQLNDTLAAMAASFDAKQYLQAASLVGRDVVIEGDSIALVEGSGTGALELAADADKVTVTIADGAGRVVRTLDLGAGDQGIVTFAWDGNDDTGTALKDGTYTIKVSASASDKPVNALPLAVGHVTGLIPGANGGSLNLAGLGRVDLASVLQIN